MRRLMLGVAVAALLGASCSRSEFDGERAERWCLRFDGLLSALKDANNGSESAARSLGSILDGLDELSPESIKDDVAATRAMAEVTLAMAGVDHDLDAPAGLTMEDTRLALVHLGEFADDHDC